MPQKIQSKAKAIPSKQRLQLHRFYHELRERNIAIEKMPKAQQVKSFWKSTLWTTSSYNKLATRIINFLLTQMKKWKTSLHVSAPNETILTKLINTLKGLFHSNCPSRLVFILCLLPLLQPIKKSKMGYSISHRNKRILISHLLFMDDTKLHTNIIRQMRNFLEIVLKFSNNEFRT